MLKGIECYSPHALQGLIGNVHPGQWLVFVLAESDRTALAVITNIKPEIH